MDPRSSAQDVHRCDLCETAIVHSHCDFCHVNLCKPCVADHISDEYDKHKIVPFKERRSTLIYPKCRTHSHKNCEFVCKNCENILVCSFCMASEQHVGHRFEELSEIYKKKKEAVENDSKELENLIFPKYEEIARDFENELANLDGGYGKIALEISKQGEEWHREIDIVVNKLKTEIDGIKVKHKDVLEKHLDKIRQTQSLIKHTLQTLRDIAESNEAFRTIEYRSDIKDFSKLPHMVQVSLPKFIPKPIDQEKLFSFFGHFTPLSSDTKGKVLSQHQPNTSVRKLLNFPERVATIETGQKKLRSVACLKTDKIWAGGETNVIKCFNIDGSVHQKIETRSGTMPYDIAVDSDGNLLYADGTMMTVFKIKNGQAKQLIRLQEWTPGKLCVTSSCDLLVTMYSDDETQSKIVRYSGSTEKQTIQFDDEGKPLYSGNGYIKYITENKNRDICVADYEAGAVVAVNQDGKLRWRYTGHPPKRKNQLFNPRGITADSQGHILTSDRIDNCVFILNQNGRFLQYIHEDFNLKNPFGVCLDNDDNLFVVELNTGNIKKIKYLI